MCETGFEREHLHKMQLSYALRMDELRTIYADTPAGYHDEAEKKQAEEQIANLREACAFMEGRELFTPVFPEQEAFVGRKEEMDHLLQMFQDGSRIVLISGMGGIGKSTLMTAFGYRQWKTYNPDGRYDLVLYLPVGGGVRKAVTDDTLLSISGMQFSLRKYRSRKNYGARKLEAIRKVTAKKSVLILLDDVREIRPGELEEILSIPADILMTSRLTARAFRSISEELQPAELSLSAMPMDDLQELAGLIRPDISPEDREEYRRWCLELQGHTLGLKMWLSAEGQWSEPATGALISIYENQLLLPEKRMLRALSLLPMEGVPREWAEKVCHVDAFTTEKLQMRSLLQVSIGQDGRERVSLHPLIAENVRQTLRPDMKNCRMFLEGVAEDVANAWNEPRFEMLLRLPVVLSILKAFPDYPAWMAGPLDKMLTFLWVMEEYGKSERGYLRLFANLVEASGEPSQAVGWMAVRVAAVYHNSLRADEAEKWYRRGLENLRQCRRENVDYWWQYMEACGKCMRGPRNRGEMDVVKELLDEASAIYRRVPEDEKTDQLLLTEAYHTRRLATYCLQTGQMEKAERYRRQMHEEMEAYFARRGVEVPRLIDMRRTEIRFSRAAGNFEEAIRLLEENLKDLRIYRGDDHKDIFLTMEQLGDVFGLWDRQGGQDGTGSDMRHSAYIRDCYSKAAAGIRSHFPFEKAWLERVERKMREL